MTPDQIRRVGRMRRLAINGIARKLRDQHQFSLRELAVLVGTNASTLSRWETGITRPRAEAALRWADALEIDEKQT